MSSRRLIGFGCYDVLVGAWELDLYMYNTCPNTSGDIDGFDAGDAHELAVQPPHIKPHCVAKPACMKMKRTNPLILKLRN